jgi:hypothetical protein
MSEIPGANADVYFGGIDEPLPDWREETEDTDDPIAADEADDNSPVLGALYGYESVWFGDREGEEDA